LLISNDPNGLLKKTKQALSFEFEMSDIGPVINTTILGLQVIYNQQAQILKKIQSRYIDFLLTKFKMEYYNPASIPMEPGQKLSKDDSPQTNMTFN
jgi:hypothetical protein